MKIIISYLALLALIQLVPAIEALNVTYKAYTDPSTWLDAQQQCETKGGQLASIESVEEHRALLTYLLTTADLADDQRDNRFFIGRNDIANEGSYVNADGSVSNEYGWCCDEPDDTVGNEDCTQYNMNKLCIDDQKCENLQYYLCSFET